MVKSKEKKTKSSSSVPTFEFDLDFTDGGSRDIFEDIEDRDNASVVSSASKKMMKKAKNFLSKSSHKSKNMELDGRSNHSQLKKKKESSTANSDYIDAGADTKSVKTKKKKKKGSLSVPTGMGDKKGSSKGFDDDTSVRKKRSKRKKKKPKGDGDDDSVESARSKRSTRSTKKGKGKPKGLDLLGMSLEVESSLKQQRRISEIEIENTALLEETVHVRRQFNEAEKALKKALAENPQIRDLEMAQNESRELKIELEEYEDAVMEKDALIKKLTDAVDAQLDKVEGLELKMERAEEEFCKMEEEMKEMEDVIDDLRSESPGEANRHNEYDSKSPNNEGKMVDEEILEQLEKRERDIEKREQELLEKEDYVLERETLIKQQDEELKKKRSSLLKPQRSFDSGNMSDNVDELETKIKQLEAENNDLAEEIECLLKHDTRTTVHDDTLAHQHEEELRSLQDNFDKKMDDINLQNEILRQKLDAFKQEKDSKDSQEIEMVRQELDILKQGKNSDGQELNLMQDNFDKRMADSKLENEILKQELDEFKQRKNTENESLRQQIEELKKQKTHSEASSRQMRRMESKRILEPESTKSLDVDDDDDEEFGLEVEVEIAELREKIVEQMEYSMKLKQEIGTYINENEDLKQDLEEREEEMRGMENQLSGKKDTQSAKLKQRDETITFMQNTMMQIMQEKQELDKKLRGSNLDRTQTKLMDRRGEDEAEKAKLDAINTELRKLDDQNRLLEEELNQFKYNSSLRLKEKESAILELQEELSDVKWELGAREKGADYITLLKDRKERKNQLMKARKDLKEAEEKILELERQSKDFEKEAESVNKSAVPDKHGEQMSGLKRQIKSLKQHNAVLEQKFNTEFRDSEDRLNEKQAKIRILEFELEKLRTPAPKGAQTAIRGAVSGFITGFGRRNDEGDFDDAHIHNKSTTEDEERNSTKTENTDRTAKENGKPGKIWSLFGQRKELQKAASKNKHIGQNVSDGNEGIGNGANKREGFEDNETF